MDRQMTQHITQHIDEEVLTELEEIMEDDFETLVQTYLVDAQQKISQIENDLSAADELNLRETAHSLKGSSSNIGAQLLSSLCGDIESCAMEQNIPNAMAILPGVKAEYDEVRSLLQSRLGA